VFALSDQLVPSSHEQKTLQGQYNFVIRPPQIHTQNLPMYYVLRAPLQTHNWFERGAGRRIKKGPREEGERMHLTCLPFITVAYEMLDKSVSASHR